jgi:membrane protein implicated in regulation of membrane protease activity
VLAYDYPLLDVFLSILYFSLFFMWIWIAVTVVVDIFRSSDLGGFAKALWFLFVVFLPFLGVFIYLVARGGKMHERQIADATAQQQAFDQYVQQTAGKADVPSQLEKLAELRDKGVISPQEFDAQKAKLLS